MQTRPKIIINQVRERTKMLAIKKKREQEAQQYTIQTELSANAYLKNHLMFWTIKSIKYHA